MREAIGRRSFLRFMGIAAAGLGLGGRFGVPHPAWASEPEDHMAVMQGTVDFMGFRAKEVTPNEEFYITTYSETVPAIAPDALRLRVDGMVDRPLELGLADLERMMDRREYVTLECIGNPVGGSAIGNAFWEGVGLRRLIESAAPRAGAVKTVFHAGDGYSDSIPYSLSVSDDAFLAIRMNGQPLPPQHGFPLRVIVPGIYGMKNVKWLQRIEIVDHDYKGYWESRGWDDQAVIGLMSQILMPMNGKTISERPFILGGIAFGGRHGVSKVEVSTDNGKAWSEAELKQELSPWSWRLWRTSWQPDAPGRHTLKVRAYGLDGKVQEPGSLIGRLLRKEQGIHAINVTVA